MAPGQMQSHQNPYGGYGAHGQSGAAPAQQAGHNYPYAAAPAPPAQQHVAAYGQGAYAVTAADPYGQQGYSQQGGSFSAAGAVSQQDANQAGNHGTSQMASAICQAFAGAAAQQQFWGEYQQYQAAPSTEASYAAYGAAHTQVFFRSPILASYSRRTPHASDQRRNFRGCASDAHDNSHGSRVACVFPPPNPVLPLLAPLRSHLLQLRSSHGMCSSPLPPPNSRATGLSTKSSSHIMASSSRPKIPMVRFQASLPLMSFLAPLRQGTRFIRRTSRSLAWHSGIIP